MSEPKVERYVRTGDKEKYSQSGHKTSETIKEAKAVVEKIRLQQKAVAVVSAPKK